MPSITEDPESWRLSAATDYLEKTAGELEDLAARIRRNVTSMVPDGRNAGRAIEVQRNVNNTLAAGSLTLAIQAASEADVFHHSEKPQPTA